MGAADGQWGRDAVVAALCARNTKRNRQANEKSRELAFSSHTLFSSQSDQSSRSATTSLILWMTLATTSKSPETLIADLDNA